MGLSIAVGHATSPRISSYPWTDAGGFGTKLADPGTLPTDNGRSVAFNSTGLSIAVAHATSPYISSYPWTDAGGFGTKKANPGTLPTGTGRSVAFNSTVAGVAGVFRRRQKRER